MHCSPRTRCRHLIFICGGLLSLLSLRVATAAETDTPAEAPTFTPDQIEFFEKEIRPILANRCQDCHGPDAQEANLRLDSRASILKGGDTGPSIMPGNPEASELIDAIHYSADSYQMPPDGKLNDDEIAALTRWVQEGAPWPAEEAAAASASDEFNLEERARHWSFQPVKEIEPPAVENIDWPLKPVDRFLLSKLEENNLAPAAATSREVWLRRVTFDLIGLPPTLAERDAFLNDDAPNAYEKVVDQLLASDQYGVRWARHWLDLMRFAETYGHEFDFGILHASEYRDYVVRAFNGDVPYDQFVMEHIAGDLLESPRRTPEGRNESVIGTAFYWLGQGKHSPVDIRAEECDLVDNQIDVLSKSFLGLTVSCARCHDHKFDPITTADYYAFASYLQSSRYDWTIVNDTPQVHRVRQKLKEFATVDQQQLSRQILNQLAEQIQHDETFLPQLKEALLAEKQTEFDWHPFYSWKQLETTDDSAKRESLIADQIAKQKASDEFQSAAVTMASFTPDETADWFFSGWGVRDEFAHAGELDLASLERGDWQFTTGSAQHTSQLGQRFHGTLRSPTFEVTHPYLHFKVRKIGGKPSMERGYKTGALNLIVDGFQIIRDPLYGSLSISVPTDGSPRWITQNASRAVGRKAYIEFLDEDDGDLIIEEIIASNNSNPPLVVHNSVIDKAITEIDPTNADEIFYSLIQDISVRAAADITALSPDEIEIVNALLRAGLPLSSNDELNKTIDEYRRRMVEHIQRLPEPETTLAITAGTPEREHVLIRGNHGKLGEEVPARYLEVFDSEAAAAGASSSRLELARQIASAENPLTARVIVNRLWQHHFGRGIVPSVDNFGVLGELPTHPELLDYLANRLIEENWSLKALHREMVLSNTYRMSSDISDAIAEEADPANRLWHRMPIQRLEAEPIRDAILAISGQLDTRLGGKSVTPHLTAFMEGRGRPSSSGPLDGDRRRSLYLMVRRNFLNPMFLAFDYPTPFTTMGRRSTSNVPAQALTMMNNPFVVQQSRLWAEKILADSSTGSADADRIRRMYLEAFCREPLPHEIELGLSFLDQQRQEYDGTDNAVTQVWSDYAHVLFNVKDFIYLY